MWSLLRQEEVVLGFVDEVSADVVAFYEEVGTHRANQELRTHEGQSDVLQYLRLEVR